MTDFIKLGLQEKQGLYFTFLLLPLLFKSLDYCCVSGCMGSCLTSLTLCLLQKRTSVKVRANVSVTFVHVAIRAPQMGLLCFHAELIKLYF